MVSTQWENDWDFCFRGRIRCFCGVLLGLRAILAKTLRGSCMVRYIGQQFCTLITRKWAAKGADIHYITTAV